ncbi:TauD/TfdA dioxygenase family protein [Actinophytocola sp.]|uniref:TauD/TfdA dioxygenase family protein n=1 Tax=Actinophytocola sp. TaxID=1872138 RepID=UPI003D6BB878
MPSSTTLDPTLLPRTPLHPFGLAVELTEETRLTDLPPTTLARWTEEARVLVLRGAPPVATDDLVAYCERWGELLRWDFGAVLDLRLHDEPKNYLFTANDVPFHWDGAFTPETPGYFLFQCLEAAPHAGGETVFSDTTKVYRDAPPDLRSEWAGTTVTYATEKVAHYGGKVTEPLVAVHPRSGTPTIRFAEPLPPEQYLNPLGVHVEGVSADRGKALLEDLSERLHRPEYCYAHDWRAGDIVVADNHALVHGRNRFTGPATRHLQRIQVI